MHKSLLDIAKQAIAKVDKFMRNPVGKCSHFVKESMAAVALIAANGSLDMAAMALNIAPSTIYRRIMAINKDIGCENFNYRRKPGPKDKLGRHEQKEIADFVLHSRPCDFGLETLYWDAPLIKFIIDFFLGKVVSESTIKRILRRCGLSYKRSEVRNIRRSESTITEWCSQVAPELLANDLLEGWQPMFLDESTISSQANRYMGWSARGQRSTVSQGDRMKVNVIGCIGLYGDSFFLTNDSTIDTNFVILFLEKLHEKYPDKKFSIYLDGARFHWSKAMRAYLSNASWVKFNAFPPYAPELNPIELLWADLKNHHLKRIDRLDKDRFKSGIDNALNELSKGISSLEKYWHATELRYLGLAFGLRNTRTCS